MSSEPLQILVFFCCCVCLNCCSPCFGGSKGKVQRLASQEKTMKCGSVSVPRRLCSGCPAVEFPAADAQQRFSVWNLPPHLPAQNCAATALLSAFWRISWVNQRLIFSSQLFPQDLTVFSIQFGIFKVSQGFSQHQKLCQGKNRFRGLRFESHTSKKPTLGFFQSHGWYCWWKKSCTTWDV